MWAPGFSPTPNRNKQNLLIFPHPIHHGRFTGAPRGLIRRGFLQRCNRHLFKKNHVVVAVILQTDETEIRPRTTLRLEVEFAFGNRVVNTAELTLPHPRAHLRRFVLEPLAEIAPEVRHPVLRKTIRELLLALPNTGENKSDCVRIMQRYP